jgi:2-C-methyl-D-erythritol 2,4-cyclodiphosphate synthase
MIKVGFGYDVHRLVYGRKLIIGGVDIPFEKGLLGHSDADVLCHALSDALLGAAGLGDIGLHFPSTDEKYQNISSLILLMEIQRLLAEAKVEIKNIDSTIVAERPQMSLFINQMKANISKSLNIKFDQISIKATTTEGLGFIGVGDGIAAYAVCLVECS